MNTSNNKRYKITDKKIENALITLLKTKDFNSIYVNDICEEAGIARTSFYSHYDDINDLILKIQNKYYTSIVNILIKNKSSAEENFTKYFHYLKDHADFYKAYFMNSDSNIIIKEAYQNVLDLCPELLQNKNKTEREIKFHMIFMGAGIKAIACKWLIDGCIESPEEMSKLVLLEYNLGADR